MTAPSSAIASEVFVEMLERRGESVGRINSVMVWVFFMKMLGFVFGFTEDYII